ncbi:MAG: DUF192 domain-containing protein [Patescibacteria group bacterium]
MKRLFNVIAIVAFMLIAILFWQLNNKQSSNSGQKVMIYQLEGKNYRLLVADEPSEWEIGLMYQRKLEGVDGMIFIFPESAYQHFWNKNTYMDLDLYWIDNKEVKGRSELPSIEKTKKIVTVNSPDKVDTVIELPKK